MDSMARRADTTGSEAAASDSRGVRSLAIDRYRGALVWLMVAGNFLAGIASVPDFVKHTPDVGLSIADLVAPCFVVAIGLNYRPSFLRRRARDGLRTTYAHFLLRYLALIGIGTILSAGGAVVGQGTPWGVLQALGEAGLICLLVIRLPVWGRFVAGAGLLVVYEIVLDRWALDAVLGTVHGGIVGGLSWGALLILATAMADLWRRGIPAFSIGIGAVTVIAAASVLLVPVSKNRVSLSYVLVTLAIAAIAFLLTDLGARLVPARAGYLAWWGENPLVLYLLHLLVLAVFVLPTAPWWYAGAPLWLAGLQLAAIMTGLSFVAWWLHRRRVRIGL